MFQLKPAPAKRPQQCGLRFHPRSPRNTACLIPVVPTDGNPPFLPLKQVFEAPAAMLGGCDVTGGISNVIPVLRRDRSRKWLMNNKALCSHRPDVSWAARGGKGFLRSHLLLSGPGGSPGVCRNQTEATLSLEGWGQFPSAMAHTCPFPIDWILFFFFFFIDFNEIIHSLAAFTLVCLWNGHLSYLATTRHSCTVSHVQPVKNSSLNMIRLDSITYYRCLSSESRASAGGCGLAARQSSVAFYHLCHTAISTTRVPDLDTSLAISGSKTLSVGHREQERRQNAHPAASDSRTLSSHSIPLPRSLCWQHTICTKSCRCNYRCLA